LAGTATAAGKQQLGGLRTRHAVAARRRRQRALLTILITGQLAWLALIAFLVTHLLE
jgi:hypothetical protein